MSQAQVEPHAFGEQELGTGVDVMYACIFGGGTVSSFKHGYRVRQVRTGGDTNTTHLCCQCVRHIVAVQVQGGDDVVLGGAQQDLLQEGVGDDVFHSDFTASLGVLEFAPWAAIDQLCAKFFLSQLVNWKSLGRERVCQFVEMS